MAEDTIAAVATGDAPAGVAIVRVSGPRAFAVGAALSADRALAPRTATLRRLADPRDGSDLDEALLLAFPGPASFTGEDVLELHVHGGRLNVARVLAAVQASGARAAEPGEFTRRAVLNGRMRLEQAEALLDLVTAETEAGLRAARSQLYGSLGAAIEALLDETRAVQAEVEASLDFPDVAGEEPDALASRTRAIAGKVRALLASFAFGKRLREGARVVLAGPPNAGKSSLFNALLEEARAIVDEEPGTTRDALEAACELAGTAVTLVDTAGLREDAGRVERQGIARAEAEIARADLVVWIEDATAPVAPPERLSSAVRVANKADLRKGGQGVAVSARTGEGLDALRGTLAARLGVDALARSSNEVVVTNRRHAEQLERAAASLDRVASASGLALELAAYELRDAIAALEAVLGRGVNDALLDAIFARFCIGK